VLLLTVVSLLFMHRRVCACTYVLVYAADQRARCSLVYVIAFCLVYTRLHAFASESLRNDADENFAESCPWALVFELVAS
jgi:hypothetical protein